MSADISTGAPQGGTPASADQGGGGGPQQAATPAPAAAPTITDTFRSIPAQFQSDPAFSKFNTTEDVFNEFKILSSLQNNREQHGMVTLPGENSTPEELNVFYEKLGKPKTAAEYGFKSPEDLPQGLDYSDERAAKFAEAAHGLNLTTAQANGVMDWYHNQIKEEYGGYEQAQENVLLGNLAALEQAWGGTQGSEAFNKHHQNAMRAFNYVADKDMAEAFKADPMLASNPLVLQVLSRLGSKMSSDSVPTVNSAIQTGSFGDSAGSAEAGIKKFYADGKFKRMMDNPSSEEGKALKAEWAQLYANQRKYLSNEE